MSKVIKLKSLGKKKTKGKRLAARLIVKKMKEFATILRLNQGIQNCSLEKVRIIKQKATAQGRKESTSCYLVRKQSITL